MVDAPMRPLEFKRKSEAEMLKRALAHKIFLETRRSVREFSSEPVPLEVLKNCIQAASSAPSGANKQPWTFVLVRGAALKKQIREAAEEEERTFYGVRAPQRWLEDLEPFATGPEKPFLETAPALIVVFAQKHGSDSEEQHYYVSESVGIACGFLLSALHESGLVALTHTPSPMKFLSEILQRPQNERPYLLIPVGYPSEDCRVPDIKRKSLEEVLILAD